MIKVASGWLSNVCALKFCPPPPKGLHWNLCPPPYLHRLPPLNNDRSLTTEHHMMLRWKLTKSILCMCLCDHLHLQMITLVGANQIGHSQIGLGCTCSTPQCTLQSLQCRHTLIHGVYLQNFDFVFIQNTAYFELQIDLGRSKLHWNYRRVNLLSSYNSVSVVGFLSVTGPKLRRLQVLAKVVGQTVQAWERKQRDGQIDRQTDRRTLPSALSPSLCGW